MTMRAGGAGYASGPYRKRALLEIEHAGALRAGRAREALLWSLRTRSEEKSKISRTGPW
jgi:hypothetical protein